ncbi:MAG: hypothetical protein FWC41_06730 [Firmicutes bacterium]|nr:hypothetical protein [Bacillota bacterium]
MQRPDVGAIGNESVRIITYLGGTKIEPFTAHYSEIEINGETFANIDDVLIKLAEIYKVFKSEASGGDGMTSTEVAAMISTHNKSITAHLTEVINLTNTTQTRALQLAHRYKFGTLTALTITAIPISATQDVVMLFETGSTFSLSVPVGTKVFGNLADVKPNMIVEMSIINGIIHFNTTAL